MKQRRAVRKGNAKRILAAVLSIILVNSLIDYSGFTTVHAQGENEVKVITAFADLENDVKEQILPLGAEENDISLPGSLTVTIETKVEEETTTVETKTEEQTTTEQSTTAEEQTVTEDKTSVSENTPVDGADTEGKPSENDSARVNILTSLWDSVETTLSMGKVYASELETDTATDRKTGASDGTENQTETTEAEIPVTWQLDTENSAYTEFKGGIAPEDYFTSFDKNGEAIETETETWEGYYEANAEVSGAFYTYIAVLPEKDSEGNTLSVADDVELPEIVVMVGESSMMLMATSSPYNISSGKITINSSNKNTYNNATITGTSTANNIVVDGTEVNLTISNLDVQIAVTNDSISYIPAIELKNGAKLNLTLADTNTLQGGGQSAGIKVPGGTTLTVTGESTGYMKVTGGSYSAGIGADGNIDGLEKHVQTLGTINIAGGTIEAYGTGPSAGIGGSAYGRTGTINITGGNVTATGGSGSYKSNYFTYNSGAGIGGGSMGYVPAINISGGDVTANGGYQKVFGGTTYAGAGIGCGNGAGKISGDIGAASTCGTISITGGTVSAKAGNNNAVNAIGYGTSATTDTSGYQGSVTFTEKVVLNLNGGSIVPLSDHNQHYQFDMTIFHTSLTQNKEVTVTITVDGKTIQDTKTLNVSNYKGTVTTDFYGFVSQTGKSASIHVMAGNTVLGEESFTLQEKNSFAFGTELAQVYLLFFKSDISTSLSNMTVQATSNNKVLTSDQYIGANKIDYASSGYGRMMIWLPIGTYDNLQVSGSGLDCSKENVAITSGTNQITMYSQDNSDFNGIIDLSQGNVTFNYDTTKGYNVTYYKDNKSNTVTNLPEILAYKIIQSGTGTINKQITISNWNNKELNLTLENLNVSAETPVSINDSKVNITLSGENNLSSNIGSALEITTGVSSVLTLQGDGKLNATTSSQIMPAIGGKCGSVIINSGVITARSTTFHHTGATIGSSENGNVAVTIKGGSVTATDKDVSYAAAIGSGKEGNATIRIEGGEVNASESDSRRFSAVIGSGLIGTSSVTITGGRVTATSNSAGVAAIGCGRSGQISGRASSNIVISGGIVSATVTGTANGIAIGTGSGTSETVSNTVDIHISGGTVYAKNNSDGYPNGNPAIGQSGSNSTATLKITGGSIYVASSSKNSGNEINITPTSDGTTPVYRMTATLSELGANQALTGANSIAEISTYGMNDVYTDGNQKVYLYLPENSASGNVYTAKLDGNSYQGTLNTGNTGILERYPVLTVTGSAKDVTVNSATVTANASSGLTLYYAVGNAAMTREQILSDTTKKSVAATGADQDIILSGLQDNTAYVCSIVAATGTDSSAEYSEVKTITFKTSIQTPTASQIAIDYEEETLRPVVLITDTLEYALTSDAAEGSWTEIPLSGTDISNVIVGTAKTIYIRKSGNGQTSGTIEFQLPARPSATAPTYTAANVTATTITLDAVANASYKLVKIGNDAVANAQYQASPVFNNLTPGVSYTFVQQLKGSNGLQKFASLDSTELVVITKNALTAGENTTVTAEGIFGTKLSSLTPNVTGTVTSTAGATVNGTWKFADTQTIGGNSVNASDIYPQEGGTTGYTIEFTPDENASSYGNTLIIAGVVPTMTYLSVASDVTATLAATNQSMKDSNWYVGNVTVNAPAGYYICGKPASGTISAETFGTATSLTVTEADGDYTYYLRDSSTGKSTSGGITEAKTIEIHIDATAPVFDNNNITYKQGSSNILKNVWNWIIGKEVITVTVPITEAGSGLNQEDISITLTKSQNNCKLENPTAGNIALSGSKGTGYQLSFTIPEEYAGTYSVSATDQAGKQGSLTAEVALGSNGMVIIDTTAPALTVNLAGTKFENSTDNIFDDNVTIQIEGNDQAGTSAGFKSLSYRLDQGSEQTIERTDFAGEKVSVFSDASLVFNTAGAHTLVVKVTDMAGNETTKSVSFKIFRITNVTINPASTITYDGMAIEEGTDFTIDKDGSTGTVAYSYQVNPTDKFTNGLPVDAGTYYVRAEIAKDVTNCKKAATKVCPITIEKAVPTYSIADQNMKLGKSLADIQKATTATGVGNETVAGTVKWYETADNRDNNGTELSNDYLFTGNTNDTITLYWSYVSTNRDYSNITGTTEFTLLDKDVPQLTVGNITKPYDGIAVTSADISGTAKVGSTGVTGTWTFADGTPTMKDAGTYPVTVQFTPDNDTDYAIATKAITVTISKKAAAIRVALTKTSITIGDSLPTASVIYSGVLNGESLTPATQPELTGMPADSNTTGTYTVTWSNMAVMQSEINVLPAAKNYDITYGETATLTINAKQSSSNTDNDSDSNSSDSGNAGAAPTKAPAVTPATPVVAPAQTSKPAQKTEPSKAPQEPVNKEVTLGQGENGKEDWGEVTNVIQDILTDIPAGSTEPAAVTVNMNGKTELPADIITLIAGKNIDLTLDMGDGISWTINGKSVTGENFSDIDLNVTKNADTIPIDIINQISGEHYIMQIELSHNGEFGFTATLNINLEKDNAGYYANLFYFHEDTEELEFMGTAQIDKEGNAALDFVHASAYTIVISEEPMGGDVLTDAADDKEAQADINTTNTNSETADQTTGSMMTLWIILGIVVVLAVSGGIYLMKRKKETEE